MMRPGLIVCCAHSFQLSMCRSVPQMPVRRTRSSTSPGPGLGWGTSCSHRPGSLFALTRAFTSGRHFTDTFEVKKLAAAGIEFRLRLRIGPLIHRCAGKAGRQEADHAHMSTAQSFLFFLILLGVAATALRLVSRT